MNQRLQYHKSSEIANSEWLSKSVPILMGIDYENNTYMWRMLNQQPLAIAHMHTYDIVSWVVTASAYEGEIMTVTRNPPLLQYEAPSIV